MPQFQHAILQWMANQPWPTGILIFAAGVLGAFHGVRLLRFLLPFVCGQLAWAAGTALTAWLPQVPPVAVPVLVMLGMVAALARPRAAVVVASGTTWGLAAAWLAAQTGLPNLAIWATVLLVGGTGITLAVVSRGAMTNLLMSLHGAAWIILGAVGMAAVAMPVVCDTFRSWVEQQSLVLPIVLAMLTTTGFAHQANEMRGDLRVGPLRSAQGPAEPG
jgi:hypothetical protein